MLGKKIEKIEREDLENLVSSAVPEGKTIEYKQELPKGTDSDKKEFLADVSSFANTIGGDLIYGIKEKEGLPVAISELEISNIDEEIRKYENIIREGIEPRIKIATRYITKDNKKYVLIFRIEKSWISPHRVIFKGHDKFYARNSAGKYPLDTSELKSAFNLSDTIIEKINTFKIKRLSQISSKNTPLPLREGGKIILHLIPIESFGQNYTVDLEPIIDNPQKLKPIYCSGWDQRINLEGVLSYSGGDEQARSYCQLYKNGTIEAVDSSLLENDSEEKHKVIPSIAYEKAILSYLPTALTTLKELDINTPIVLFLTFVGVKGYKLSAGDAYGFRRESYEIDRDILQLPEIIIESYDIKPEEILKPIFDLVWNSCGFKRSYNFDEDGNWIAK